MICGEVLHDLLRRGESEKGVCAITQKGYK